MSICKECGCNITDPIFSKVYVDPNNRDLEIGPYCPRCVREMRICCGCDTVHKLGDTLKYYGNQPLCGDCASSREMCGDCLNLYPSNSLKEVGDKRVCKNCISKFYSTCSCCNQIKNKNHIADGRNERILSMERPTLFEKYPIICDMCMLEEIGTGKYPKRSFRRCENCNTFYHTDVEGAHKRYCSNCLPHLESCDDCGKVHHRLHRVGTDGTFNAGSYNSKLCPQCYKKDNSCVVCSCRSKKPLKVPGLVSSHTVCQVHKGTTEVQECSTCLSVFIPEEGNKITFEEAGATMYVCYNCLERYYRNSCEECGRIRDHNGKCRVCNHTAVYNYTFKPHPIFNYGVKDIKDKHILFMGIENEVTYSSRLTMETALKYIYSYYNPTELVAKSDASIDGYGFEIVTQPMTLRLFNKSNLTHLFKIKPNRSSSCGMHVHVGRNTFTSDIHLHKVITFIHDNEPYINTIVGRNYNNYNRKLDKKAATFIKESKESNFLGYADRNVRVNLNNDKTVEFRMFSAATQEFHMRYKVEWLHALILWLGEVDHKHKKLPNFHEYIFSNRMLYPNICKLIKVLKSGGVVECV